MPSLSVIIPCFNDADKLPRLLSSFHTSSGDSVVAVDDGSAVPVDLRYPRVIRHEKNQGPAAARNTGVAATQSDYVFFADADVILAPGILDRFRMILDTAPPTTVGIFGDFVWDNIRYALGPFDYAKLLQRNLISPMSMWRREALGLFRDTLYEDWDLWLRILNPDKHPGRTVVYDPVLVFATTGRRRSQHLPSVRATSSGIEILKKGS